MPEIFCFKFSNTVIHLVDDLRLLASLDKKFNLLIIIIKIDLKVVNCFFIRILISFLEKNVCFFLKIFKIVL